MGFIKYLFQVSRLDEGPKVEKQRKAGPRVNNFTIVRYSHAVGIMLILSAITQLILTLIVPVSNQVNIYGVYARNISSIACFAALALFMMSWCGWIIERTNVANEDDDEGNEDDDNDGFFRFIIILSCILSALKGLYSAGLAVHLIYGSYITTSYYVCDAIGWLAIALFLLQTYRLLFTSKSSLLDRKNYRKFFVALIVIFMIKAVVSLIYTLMGYNPQALTWPYYLADALAWFLLVFFFSLYRNSKVAIASRNAPTPIREKDAKMEKALDIAAKIQIESYEEEDEEEEDL